MCQILVMLMLAAGPASAADEETHQAIALFLYNFSNYVDWPSDAFVSKNGTLNMCVVGEARFVPYLDAFEGALIRDRRLSIVKLPQINLEKNVMFYFWMKKKNA